MTTRRGAALAKEHGGTGDDSHEKQYTREVGQQDIAAALAQFDKEIRMYWAEKLTEERGRHEDELAAVEKQIEVLRKELEGYKAGNLSQPQYLKISSIVDTAIEAAAAKQEQKWSAEVQKLRKEVTATARRIQDLEKKQEQQQQTGKREEAAAATAAAANEDMTRELALLQATVDRQKSTLDALANQHCNYDSAMNEMKQISSKLAKVERGVADNNSRAAATAEKQELLRVLPLVLVDIPVGQKTEAMAAVDGALSKGLEEAEKRQQQVPKDMGYSSRPFGNKRAQDGSSSSSSGARKREKIMLTFMSAEAAAFFVRNKRKLPDGIYAEPMLTAKEHKEKGEKFSTFKALKEKGRHVTWHRAALVEFTKVQGRGAGRWREVVVKADSQAGAEVSIVTSRVKGGK
jgi:uncharacterized phage infection (PIP) family protein YhgE